MDIVYFDLETQRTFNDVGGHDRKGEMGVSVAVTYGTGDGRYEIFSEMRVGDLVDRLRRADLVVGYNVVDFDYEVLMGYVALDLAECLPTLDLLVEVEKAVGRRLKLEDVAVGTLGFGKTAGGLDAIRWWREGRHAEVAEYCCYDVKVTRLVHEHGVRHGQLGYVDRLGARQTFEVSWGA
jgi:hypothetical protein